MNAALDCRSTRDSKEIEAEEIDDLEEEPLEGRSTRDSKEIEADTPNKGNS